MVDIRTVELVYAVTCATNVVPALVKSAVFGNISWITLTLTGFRTPILK